MKSDLKIDEKYIDPFLREIRGWNFILEGMRLFKNEEFDTANDYFIYGLGSITYDFIGCIDTPFTNEFEFDLTTVHDRRVIDRINYYNSDDGIGDNIFETVRNFNSSTEIFESSNAGFECKYFELLWSSYIISFSNDNEKLNAALDTINKLIVVKHEYFIPHYIKGKILIILNREAEAKVALNNCPDIPNIFIPFPPMVFLKLYLERKKENVYYLNSLVRYYLAHPYSIYTLLLISKYNFKNYFEINYETDVHKYFANENAIPFDLLNFKTFIHAFNTGNFEYILYEYQVLIISIEPNKANYKTKLYLKVFYQAIRNKYILLLNELPVNNPEEEDYDKDDDNETYNSSNERYGHDDWSDDDIDDIFGGDPSNTWNVE
ncbi:MAG: hypothetical protein WCO54_12010 [Bacteroidota bacterium]